jgi:hypothetical protein
VIKLVGWLYSFNKGVTAASWYIKMSVIFRVSLLSKLLNQRDPSVVSKSNPIKEIGKTEKVTIFNDKENISFEARLVT